MTPSPPCLILAGTQSGVGKTTVALGLMAALKRRGLVVQGFKVGPDFIDPGHHTRVTGRPSRNLDTWMLDPATVRALYCRAARGADICLIEGAMGLFDGCGALDERGSTADLARVLGVPVVLVVDARAIARSVAAMVHGYSTFDPAVRVAGVICCRVAGPSHYAYLAPALERATAVQPLGYVPRRDDLSIPERHLGLVTVEDHSPTARFVDALAGAVEAGVNLDALRALARPATHVGADDLPAVAGPAGPPVRVAVARDAAFCFYYEDNLDLLRAHGAETVTFSPLADGGLPPGSDLIYLGGGYPELHGPRLAANPAMLEAVAAHYRRGGAIYAECGGLMYLCRTITDLQGAASPMVGLVDADVRMQPARAALGYVTIEIERECLLGPAGTALRGHVFHYSALANRGPLVHATRLRRPGPGRRPEPDGIAPAPNLLAGYAHVHFASNPAAVVELLGRARAFRQAPPRTPGGTSLSGAKGVARRLR